MKGLIYLYKKTVANRIKKALHRPVAYAMIIFLVLYAAMLYSGFQTMIAEADLASPENLVTVLSCMVLLLLPSNVISYAKRKGLLFRPAEVHFVFSAPVSPKMVLMFTGVKSFAMNILVGIFICIMARLWFHAGILQILVYFLFFVVFESILEASIIIFCYGNERFSETFFKGLRIIMYGLLLVVVGIAAYLMLTREPSFGLVREYLSLPVIQMIPIVGWNIAVTRLIFLGADTINVIGSVLFLVSTVIMFLIAWKMKCTGAYYEDAMKFADEYQTRRANQKKGVVSLGFGKKKKFKEAAIEYKGSYAKAIYFRQMLEYKKNKTFIFGWNTLVCFVAGVMLAAFGYFNEAAVKMGEAKIFVIPGVVAYLILICSGYATKWSKELENPYTYLIPDSPLKKVWYSTKIEHIRAVIDGILITVPAAVVFELGPVMTVLTILLYICLMANRLYYGMLADALIGNTLGNTGRTWVKMLFQGIAMMVGIVAALIGGAVGGMEVGFAVMIAVVGALTFAGAAGASVSFLKMEVFD